MALSKDIRMSKTPFEFFGSETLPVASHKVWVTLQNPVILQQLIPGIERLEKTTVDTYEFTARIKLSILKPALSGRVTYTDVLPENQLGLRIEQHSKVGSAHMDVLIRLESCAAEETELNYRVQGTADGLIAKAGVKALEKLSGTAIQKFIESLDDLIRQQELA